jgi:predicted ATP-grasp superfamily ATP-dependent carboligase
MAAVDDWRQPGLIAASIAAATWLYRVLLKAGIRPNFRDEECARRLAEAQAQITDLRVSLATLTERVAHLEADNRRMRDELDGDGR